MRPGVEAGALPPGVLQDKSDRAKKAIEVDLGLRCVGCAQRIRNGFEFSVGRALMKVGDLAGPRKVETGTFYTCAGENGCDAMAGIMAQEDTIAVRRIEPGELLFMDDPQVVTLLRKINARASGRAVADGAGETGVEVPADGALQRDPETGAVVLDPKGGPRG